MSTVNASDTRIIKHSEDVIDAYCCAGENSMTGVEVEYCYIDPSKPEMPAMSPNQNEIAMNAALKQFPSGAFNNEPSSDLMEANSIPDSYKNLDNVFEDITKKMKCLEKETTAIGLKRSPFQDIPHLTAQDFLENIVNVERYQAFFNPPRDDMRDIAAYFTVSKSTQVSISYKNYEHMFKNIRLLYLLAPFFFILTDNSSGFDEGIKHNGHAGMKHRTSLKIRGGFPSYVFTSQNGEEYVEAHIKNVIQNAMYVYYDENNKLQQLPSGIIWTFENEIKQRGLNTAANYYLAQSILWPDVKIASIKDNNGNVTHHRYEARMFGVGVHQAHTALLLVSALSYDEEFADRIAKLLQSFKMCTKNAPQCIDYLRKSYKHAENHDGKFMDIQYGNGIMQDFAQKFANILKESDTYSKYSEYLQPVITICETGWTDTRVNQHLLKTLNDAKQHIRDYDTSIFDDPTQCAYTLFHEDRIS